MVAAGDPRRAVAVAGLSQLSLKALVVGFAERGKGDYGGVVVALRSTSPGGRTSECNGAGGGRQALFVEPIKKRREAEKVLFSVIQIGVLKKQTAEPCSTGGGHRPSPLLANPAPFGRWAVLRGGAL